MNINRPAHKVNSRSNRAQLLSDIWNGLRRLQQLNRQSGIKISPALGIRETFFLLYVDLHPDCAIVDARNFHRFHQSVGWVLVKELERKKLIKLGAGKTDARSRALRITEAGSNYLRKFDILQNKHVRRYLLGLSARDTAHWEEYLRILADGCGVAAEKCRASEHPLRVQMRRAFIALGFLEADFVASGLTLVQYQLLSELHYNQDLTDASSIARTIGVAAAGVVFNVSALKRKGLIASGAGALDRRKKVLSLTRLGIAKLSVIDRRLQATLQRGLVKLSNHDLRDFLSILGRATASGEYSPDLKRVKIGVATSDHDLFLARAFLVEFLVRHKQHFQLTEQLLPKSHRVVLAVRDGVPVALAEYRQHLGKWKMSRVVINSKEAARVSGYRFTQRAAELVGK